MPRLLQLALLLPLVLGLCGCRTIGQVFEGVNSDLRHGGAYARVPQTDAEGQLHVPPRDWTAGPERTGW